ncbi:MAG: hypothetical protein RR744_09725 [Cellulosilyticaceae bacterium]
MNIRVHYPSTEEGLQKLNEKIATAHAEAVVDYIDNLDCSYEKKMQLLKRAADKN